MEFVHEYGLFLAKAITLIAGGLVLVVAVMTLGSRQRAVQHEGQIEIRRLNERYRQMGEALRSAVQDPALYKQRSKAERKAEKASARARRKARKKSGGEAQDEDKPRLFVLHFKGDLRASATDNLREEISVLLSQAQAEDEVLVQVESPGGLVHGYGLAASQLQRVRAAGVPLTVAVDKVAASGGYMMACVANHIIAAPFAVIGSIGVLAQIPNFHRLLKKHDIDYELLTAGEFKRTLTLFGENTPEGRAKFQEDLEDTHALFKSFVADNRPQLDIARVATGEIWYGSRALENGLVDALQTSDEFIQQHLAERDVFELRFVHKKNWQEKLGLAAEGTIERALLRLLQRGGGPHY